MKLFIWVFDAYLYSVSSLLQKFFDRSPLQALVTSLSVFLQTGCTPGAYPIIKYEGKMFDCIMSLRS